MPVTDHVNSIATLVNFTVTRLETEQNWTVYFLPGGADADLLKYFPDLKQPAAALMLQDSKFQDSPRKKTVLRLILCVDGYQANPESALATLCDRAAGLLDSQTCGDAYLHLTASGPVKIDPSLVCRFCEFQADDH